MIQHDVFNGVVHNDFEAFKNLGKMTLSLSAQKIKDMPNAGGDSVASEVLSYEVLHKCFGAKLLKVSTCILMTMSNDVSEAVHLYAKIKACNVIRSKFLVSSRHFFLGKTEIHFIE